LIDKVILAEIADFSNWQKYTAMHANAWGVVSSNDYNNIIAPELEPKKLGLESSIAIFSYVVDKVPYTRVNSIETLLTSQKAFYFEDSTRLLLVHFEDNKTPYHYLEAQLEIGFTLGFYSSTTEDFNNELNDQNYYNRLISRPSTSKKKDDFYFSKQVYIKGKVEIDNGDYKFINFSGGLGGNKKAGAPIRILEWEGDIIKNGQPAYSDFKILQQGIINRITESNILAIEYADLRTKLDAPILENLLNTANFEFIKDPDKEYLKPQLWGNNYGVPCICLNENVNKDFGATAYIFMVADSSLVGYSDGAPTIKLDMAADSIKKVYIDGIEDSITPTVINDLGNDIFYFSIDASFFSKDGKYSGQNKLSIDVEGYQDAGGVLMSNGLHIIRELLYQAYKYSYTNGFYDVDTWEIFENDPEKSYNIGLLISKNEKLQSTIEEIANSMIGSFIWDENLKFTFSNDDFEDIAGEITKEKFYPLRYIPKISSDSTKVLSTFRVGTKRNWATRSKEKAYFWVLDETNKINALLNYNSKTQKDFRTLLYNSVDIESFKKRIHFFGDISNDVFTIIVPWGYKNANAGEFYAVYLDLPARDFKGRILAQVIAAKQITSDFTVSLKFRIFEYNYYVFLGTDIDDEIIADDTNNKLYI